MFIAACQPRTGGKLAAAGQPATVQDTVAGKALDIATQRILWLERDSGDAHAYQLGSKFYQPFDPLTLLRAFIVSPTDPVTKANLIGAEVLETNGSLQQTRSLVVKAYHQDRVKIGTPIALNGYTYVINKKSALRGQYVIMADAVQGVWADGPVKIIEDTYTLETSFKHFKFAGPSTWTFTNGSVLTGDSWTMIGTTEAVSSATFTAADQSQHKLVLNPKAAVVGHPEKLLMTADHTLFLSTAEGSLKAAAAADGATDDAALPLAEIQKGLTDPAAVEAQAPEDIATEPQGRDAAPANEANPSDANSSADTRATSSRK